jgi:tetrahydromethanopterin:alpha-L-glutamate ligase
MRIAIFSDETGWHTRQLQAALRARGAVGRCVDLAECHIDTTGAAPHGLVIPGFGRELPQAALVRGIAGGSFEQVTKRLSTCMRCASSACRSTTMRAPSNAASTRQ